MPSAGGDGGVRGVAVELPRAAGRQNDGARGRSCGRAAREVERLHAGHAAVFAAITA